MRTLFGLLGLGIAASLAQGVIAIHVPVHLCPDLSLLVVVAIALAWRRAVAGLVLASAFGYLADVLSGSLLGLHALVRVGVYLATLLPSRHFSLRGWFPLALFAALVTVGNAVAVAALTAFGSGSPLDPGLARDLAPQVLVNAVAAPAVLVVVQRLVALLDPDEPGRRLLRFDTRSFPA